MQTSIGSYRSPQPSLMLSFFPIEFEGNRSLAAGILPFESREQLRTLREQYQKTHVFHRSGTEILSIPLTDNAEQVGDPTTVSVEDYRIAERLVREALSRHFRSLPYELIRFMPLTLVNKSRNLLTECLSQRQSFQAPGLGIFPKYELHAQTVFPPHPGEPLPGIAVSVSTACRIEATTNELISRGLDIRGRYVVDSVTGKLLGRADSMSGNKAILSDHRGNQEVELGSCRLEASKDNFSFCVQSLFGDAYGAIETRLEDRLFTLLGGVGMRSTLQSIQKHLQDSGPFECAANLRFRVADFLVAAHDGQVVHRQLQKPNFIFHPSGTKTSWWHDNGLNEFGPFDAEFFTSKEPKIVVITPADLQGEAETFVRQLRDGLANSDRFQKGFVRKYHLNSCKIEVHPFERSTNIVKAYREACLEVLQDNYDLALVVIQENFHKLEGDANPYLVSKAVFMSQGVPVQEVEIETIRASAYSLQYILNNIALACYCKLSGIPYAITASPVVAQELVIGLGSAIIRRQRLQSSERVVGITTIFNADGTYLLSNASREVDYNDYIDELRLSLRSCTEEVRRRNAWQDGDQVRLIFHVFKPLRNMEAIAIKRFVEEIAGRYQVEFAFLTFVRDHPFAVLDCNQRGIPVGQRKKGELVPERGWGISISRNAMLLTLTGPVQLKTPTQACPKPMLVRLHKESTFRDTGYLAHQAYKFTFLSWRSFFPTTTPVTIEYSQLIARMLGQLREVSNWNPDVLRTKLRTSRWFL
ncbi:MAG: hypothetical protein HYX88_04580 [Chloroflexi bacterium]|nr:hypothetical protein [Chloroflexota bacterium]